MEGLWIFGNLRKIVLCSHQPLACAQARASSSPPVPPQTLDFFAWGFFDRWFSNLFDHRCCRMAATKKPAKSVGPRSLLKKRTSTLFRWTSFSDEQTMQIFQSSDHHHFKKKSLSWFCYQEKF
jgi:hypothetical protein